MKRLTQKAFVLAVCIVGIALIAGCEEESKIDTKKSRLIAAENMQLKKDLEECQKEIEKQKELLEQCEQAKKDIEEQSAKNIEDLFDGIFGDVLKESQALREENEKLKVEIMELEAQVQQLEKLKKPSVPQPLPSTPNSL